MTEEIIKKNRFLKGNQYARKHGFYSNVLDETQLADFEKAITIEGLDEEIALLRVKIKAIIQNDPENLRLIMQGINALMKLVMTKFNISKDDKESILKGVANVLKDVALPVGIGIGSILKK